MGVSGGGDFFIGNMAQKEVFRRIYYCEGTISFVMSDRTEKEIFIQAEGISDPTEQSRFLKRACKGDTDLLQRIGRLLSAHGEGKDFIPMDPAEQTHLSSEPAPREGEGSIIDRYKLLQNIGEGGCGVVYMAEQQEPVVRRVALKIIKLGMDTKQVIARFEAERQALAMMDHPNIAKVLDAGSTENGRPYFVMELVRGVPITEFCDQQNLDTKERLKLFMDVCSAIQHAHQKGVIHRDIKPSNILVTMHDHKAVPKIIDFGIAKATQQRLTDKTLFTQFHQFIGTPAYMSPEQAQMSGLDVDTRTDIYSLGVLLYELLTGRTPLDAKELTKADYDEMRRRIREEEPVYPSTQLSSMNVAELTTTATRRNTEPARLNRMMRGELDWIVMKALEKDRNRRYETAAELALDVQRYLNFEPVKAAAPSSFYRFRKFARRNQAALITAAIILILLSVASVVSTGLAIKATIAQRSADALAKKSQAAQELAELREQDANEQRNLVISGSRALRQNLYASDMYQAQHFLRDGNIAKSRELLLKYLPADQEQEPLRGFEWQYLWDRSKGDELFVFEDLERPTGALAFSNDGTLLAAISADGKVCVWNVQTRMRVALIETKVQMPWVFGLRIQFSKDDRFLYVGGRRNARLSALDTSNWSQVACFKDASFPLIEQRAGQFAAYSDGDFKLFNVAQQREAGATFSSFPLAGKEIRDYAFTADRKMIAVQERNDELISIHDVQSGRKMMDWPHSSSKDTGLMSIANGLQYVAWMPEIWNRSVAEVKLRLFQPFEEREIELEHSQPGLLIAAEFSPDTQWLVAGGWDYLLHVWEPSSGAKRGSFKGHLDEIFCVAFAPNSQTLASSGKDGRVYLWDLRSMKSKPDLESVTFTKSARETEKFNSREEFAGLFPSALWAEFERGDLDYFLPYDFKRRGWHISPDGTHLAHMGKDQTLEIHNLNDSRFEASLDGVQQERRFSHFRVSTTFISNDRLLYRTSDGFALWNVRYNRNEPNKIPEDFVSFKGASSDGRLLAMEREGEEAGIVVWDFDAEKDVSVLSGMDHGYQKIVFSPDSTLAIATGWDKRGLVWNTATGAVEHVLTGHKQGIHAAAFAHDQKSICTSSPDGTIRIWHMETGREMLTFTPDGVGADRLLFSKDNQKLLIIGIDKTWLLRVPGLGEIDQELTTTFKEITL
jgi:serine/threonine protein kinase/WD40 repeat protein